MFKVSTAVDADGLAKGKLFYAVWKLRGCRHVSPADKNGDDRNLSRERCLQFNPHPVCFTIDTAIRPSLATKPLWSDNSQQDICVLKRHLDLFSKIDTRADVINIAEDGLFSESLDEPVEDATGDVL